MARASTAARAGCVLASFAAVGASGAAPLVAQPALPDVVAEYAPDDEAERYLRTLQTLGAAPLEPWSLRGFSPPQLDRLTATSGAHPWIGRLRSRETAASASASVVRPRVGIVYNSAFPFGGNDGAVWAGRGVTAVASGGLAARWGIVSLVANPVAFWSQNQPFSLLDNGLAGAERFADGLYPGLVDRPQRFGDDAYARVDPGNSTLRIDAFGATLGVSTANEWWGPAQEFPFLLGTNAAGFPHAFVGTSRPRDLWLAHVHARLLYGRLEQSEYFVPRGELARSRRFATGLAIVLTPRGLPNLEIGGARFFHAPWPDQGLPGRYFGRAFEGLYKTSLPEVDDPIQDDSRSIDGENQLASVFVRLVLPRAGFEVYGEIGREDHPWDLRHLILSPDEQSSLTAGFRRSWRRGDGLATVRGEVMSFRQRQVDRFRLGPAVYLHAAGSNQGHTNRGQVLGADVGVGSASGAHLAVDLYDRRGRTTFEWRRIVRQERVPLGAVAVPPTLDVLHAVGAERLVFRGATDLAAGLDLVHDFDRNFAGDETSVRLRVSARGWPW